MRCGPPTTEELINAAQYDLRMKEDEAWALDLKVELYWDMLMSASKQLDAEREMAKKRTMPTCKRTGLPERDWKLHNVECNLGDAAVDYAKARAKSQTAWRRCARAEKKFNKLCDQRRADLAAKPVAKVA